MTKDKHSHYYTISGGFKDTEHTLNSVSRCFEKNDGMLQLRFKDLSSEELETKVLMPLSLKSNEDFVLNKILLNCSNENEFRVLSRLVGKYKLGGLHLTGTCLKEIYAIKNEVEVLTNSTIKIAASCHNEEEIQIANNLPLCFIVLSPVKPSISCPSNNVLGWDKFSEYAKVSIHPCYALGGLNAQDYSEAISYGAAGIAAINAFWNLNKYD
ncbi:thiamine phosphate synthase [Neoconidiobolus thromboides FSU 785]|nr:thiamine phosphate synthase [Neoconidiobolus thromboides FSU 785]